MGHAFQWHYRSFWGWARPSIPVFTQPFRVYSGRTNKESAAVSELDEYPHAEYAFRIGNDIINSWDTPDVFFETFRVVSRPIGLLHAAYWCQSEVFNGGLRQFLWNSAGMMGPEAVEGFVAIGQPMTA